MRYFLGLLAIVAFVVLIVVVFTRQGPRTPTVGNKIVKLTDYVNKNSEVRLTIDGSINAEENHRSIQISITPNSRTLTVFQGYDQTVLRQQAYPNASSAYDNFLRALANLSFIKERTGIKQTDERGVCPTGNRYIYQLREDDKDVTRLWSTSCSGGQGTFAGNGPTVRDLFQRQIPDYAKLTADVRLTPSL